MFVNDRQQQVQRHFVCVVSGLFIFESDDRETLTIRGRLYNGSNTAFVPVLMVQLLFVSNGVLDGDTYHHNTWTSATL